MALRTQAAAFVIFAALANAQDLTYEVRHVHPRKGAPGTLAFDTDGVKFTEPGKKAGHSRQWRYEEIQWLDLSPSRLRIVTYEDVRWQLGRDRVYVFDELPEGMTARLYPLLGIRLDQRFIAEVADEGFELLWEQPAKMIEGRGGPNGTIRVGSDRIVFQSPKTSRTWRYRDIRSITTEQPFELTLTSLDRETRFQLKQFLPEERYNDLWRRVSEANGLKPFQGVLENHD
jgi:hypothetical protein